MGSKLQGTSYAAEHFTRGESGARRYAACLGGVCLHAMWNEGLLTSPVLTTARNQTPNAA